MDSQLDNLGEDVILVFKPTVSNIDNNFNDIVRDEDLRKPSYKQTTIQQAPDVQENFKVIKALVRYNPKDFETFDTKVLKPMSILKLKCRISDIPDLKRCEYIIPSSQDQKVFDTRYSLLREPIPIGIKENIYCISYWERI